MQDCRIGYISNPFIMISQSAASSNSNPKRPFPTISSSPLVYFSNSNSEKKKKMSSSNKKKLILNTVSVSLGCSSCKKPKLTDFFNPKPKPKSHSYNNNNKTHSSPYSNYSSSSSSKKTAGGHCSFSEYETATSFSPSTDDVTPNKYWDMDSDEGSMATTVRGFGRVGGESLAVEKDSDDPYLDFRQSMLQMILEKEIYSKDDLKELLNCFLHLNSPYYHWVIVRAFTEIWNGVFSIKPGTASSASAKLHCGGGFRPCDF